MQIESARILAVFPTPSISHQIVFQPLTQELAKRGHEVVVITTDPAFTKESAPKNLREIDLHDLSYNITKSAKVYISGEKTYLNQQVLLVLQALPYITKQQFLSEEVQSLVRDSSVAFDLLIVELLSRPALAYSHIYKVPVIEISSFGGSFGTFEMLGASSHPLLYPLAYQQKSYNLTLWEKIIELYSFSFTFNFAKNLDDNNSEVMKRIVDTNIPPIAELEKKVQMCFLNNHPLWDFNRPVPKNVLYINGISLKSNKALPEDLKTFIDKSKHGVIYVSFGTNYSPSCLPPEKIQVLMNVFSQLHYNVLLKWDKEDISLCPKNVRVQKWYPQSDLLKHPNIKAFVTQGGLQSTDEAIDAGVPLVAIPLQGDQWLNTEKYEYYKIGIKIEMESLTEDTFRNAIKTVVRDASYRRNILKLRAIMRDEAQTALQRAVWWTEHVLRHGGAHLRAPAAGVSWSQYYEIDLVVIVLIVTLTSLVMIKYLIYSAVSRIFAPTLKLPEWKSD
ncbi:UDP-glucosyltransferase 2-like [Melitaea cinxia]|uniref:UDP-glucosyltransferase 2-like n=1 Tax=Melitaea cinxia TaxID=113334 RepID=UPI001E273ACF|nr:UDP-glucosyltransferase 2-like [Melitaea cinxia]